MQKLGEIHEIKVKEERGITLLAITVTVIVLLVLAGIPIVLMGGENGLINNALSSKRSVESKKIDENVELAVTCAIAQENKDLTEKALVGQLNEYIGVKGTDYILDGNARDGWTLTLPEKEKTYEIDGEGKIVEIEYQEPIDNSGSLVLSLVDDLGTRSTIYLYNNTDKITSGSITITKPDNTT